MESLNWKVRLYDTDESIIEEYTIVNRTKSQAVKETMHDPSVRDADTWSISEEDKNAEP